MDSPKKGYSFVRWALRLVGPVLLAVVLLRIPDRDAVLRTLTSAAPLPLIAALALNFVNIELKVIRWQVLLRTRGIAISHARAWPMFLSAAYIGMLTPGRVGDVLRVQYLRHEQDVPFSEGLASVVMDRLCDLYGLAAFVAIGVARFSPVFSGDLSIVAWGTVGAVTLGPLLLLVPGIADRALGAVARRFFRGDASGAARFLEALRANVGKSLWVTMPLTFATFGINYVQGWLMARALGIELALFDVACLMAIASLLSLIPISVSGVGVRELFFSIAFPVVGLSAEQGVSFSLLVLAVIHLAIVGLGFVSFQIAPPPTGPDRAEPG